MELKIHEGYKKENMDDNSNIPSSNESLGKIWDHIIKNIGLTELVYNTFFADSKALSIKEDVFTVVVPMEFAKRPLKDHTLSIEEKLKNIYNKNIKFEVICENEVKDYNLGISNTKEKENTTDKKTGLKSEFTFNNFVVGESNKHAHSAALATALEPGYSSYNPLFFYSREDHQNTKDIYIERKVQSAHGKRRPGFVQNVGLRSTYSYKILHLKTQTL